MVIIRTSLSGAITRQRHARIPTDEDDRDDMDDVDGPEDAKQMRVGSQYQAIVPDIPIGRAPAPLDYEADKEILIWSPRDVAASCHAISDEQVSDYLRLAKDKYNYDVEQALGLLNWHKYDLEAAQADLANYTPIPDEWSVEDKVLFEQAFGFHEKQFHKIRQMLPEKSFGSLVKYYYSWKKTRSRTASLMDRSAKKLQQQLRGKRSRNHGGGRNDMDGDEDSGSASSDDDADADQDDGDAGSGTGMPQRERCTNCSVLASEEEHSPHELVTTSKGLLCRVCHDYWKKTGMMKHVKRSEKEKARAKRERAASSGRASAASGGAASAVKAPRGIHLNPEDLLEIASGPEDKGAALLRALDSEIEAAVRAIQGQKEDIERLKEQLLVTAASRPSTPPVDIMPPPPRLSAWLYSLTIPEIPLKRSINARWSHEEILIAVQSFRRYGTDFRAIAEVVGNKTENHIKNFYSTYKSRFHLEEFVAEYKRENGLDNNEKDDDSD